MTTVCMVMAWESATLPVTDYSPVVGDHMHTEVVENLAKRNFKTKDFWREKPIWRTLLNKKGGNNDVAAAGKSSPSSNAQCHCH